MENLDFSEEEIEQQLAALGYTNVTKQRLREFKRDLDVLIFNEKSKSQTSAEWSSPQSHSTAGRSPPVITKEKVQVHRGASNYSYIYPHRGEADQERLVLAPAFQGDSHSYGVNRPYDSYIKHSVAPRHIRPSTAPNRLEVEEAPSDDYHSVQDTQMLSPDRGLHMNVKPAVKRKVLRKHRGQSHVFDESSYSEDSDSVSMLEERLDQLRVSAAGGESGERETESEETYSDSDRQSSATVELPSAFEAYMKGMKRSRSENDIRLQPKAFIRAAMDHPHTRNLKKNDPVAKYFQYKQDWDMFKPPGEKNRKELHRAIREQLMYQPPPPKPQRTYVPNTYVVPTEKKRSALRWAVRHDLANGLIPPKITYP